MKTTEKAGQVLRDIIALFEQGNLPEAIVRTTIAMPDVPARTWSLGNRLLVWSQDTIDARTFRQWQAVGRYPQKGTKALYILQPMLFPPPDEEQQEEGAGRLRLAGFKACPVFRVEDTEGKPIDYALEPAHPPPLSEVAQAWGIEVRYLPTTRPGVYGYHRAGSDRTEIGLHTHDVQVFAHELAHAAHARVRGGLKGGQHWDQEVVAELTAATLCRMYEAEPNEGGAYRYIRHYAEQAGYEPGRACMTVLKEVEQCLGLILQTNEEQREAA